MQRLTTAPAALAFVITLLEQESPFFTRPSHWNPVFKEVLRNRKYLKVAFRVGSHLFVCLCPPSNGRITPNVNSLPVLKWRVVLVPYLGVV